ncbi:unnamed protein product [Musa acuminata var. zebrina]
MRSSTGAKALTMAAYGSPPSSHLLLAILIPILLLTATADANEERKVYIVYMGHQTSSSSSTEAEHLNLLKQVLEGCAPCDSLVYSYTKSFNALAAKLLTKEMEKLAGMKGVVSVFPSKILHPRTTRSWDFLGFPATVNRNPPLESDVIVGMIDTGIWPESESFNDQGLGPPPRKWKGDCINLKCNNKIIGARYYNSLNDTSQEESPRDFNGHGTHTASTVAGKSVQGASLYGLAGGTARGGVPSARLAVYKVCWSFGCAEQDILAAFDDAIADGVDIISISIGYPFAFDYFLDVMAIGSFHAMKKGVLTSASGGNSGPYHGTVGNVAPWMLVSAASSTDRHIIDKLVTGDQRCVVGASVNTFATEKESYPFVYFGDGSFPPADCTQLDEKLVKGKIVLCGYIDDGTGAYLAGAKGAVMLNDAFLDTSSSFPLPAIAISYSNGEKLMQYINKTNNPVANIHKSEAVFDPKAPVVGSFSSRGPNTITADILKPDISAPGIDILAAWSTLGKVSGSPNDTRSVEYNIISGTSMACPHTSGAAAYVKSFHPSWSPAAIMSALMTTAKPMNPSLHPDAELAYGAGQLNPVKAVDPGLVFDATDADYVQMLCDEGYNKSMIRIITGDDRCCSSLGRRTARDLNYPSMALHVASNESFAGNFTRSVTNVGDACSIYRVKIKADGRLKVVVNPKTLVFTKPDEKQGFVVSVSGGPMATNSTASASIVWLDGKHSVRSAMVVYTDFTS